MSKKMIGAYRALRMKDMATAIANVVLETAIASMAIALILCNSAAFLYAAIMSLSIFGLWMAVRLVAFLCDRRMKDLGFDEVGLERLAWA